MVINTTVYDFDVKQLYFVISFSTHKHMTHIVTPLMLIKLISLDFLFVFCCCKFASGL